MLMNRDQGVEPDTMCLVCLRPVDSTVTPFLSDWMNTVHKENLQNSFILAWFHYYDSVLLKFI